MKALLALALVLAAVVGGLLLQDPHRDIRCMATRIGDLARDRDAGWYCLHHAAARGDLSAVKAGIAHDRSIDLRSDDGRTPLNIAAEYGQLETAQWLIAQGAELEARDAHNGFTALHWAAERYRPAIARALIAAGARVDVENAWQQTPLWIAAWQPEQGNTEIAHILVGAGADIENTDDAGNTPLIMAARAGHRPMIDYLLGLGADLAVRNDDGRSALFQAVAANHPRSVRLLLARGANPNASSAGVTPLELALNEGHRAVVDLLVANGAEHYERYAAAAAMRRARAAFDRGDHAQAARDYGAAIALRPASAEAYYRRGLARAADNDGGAAEADLQQALSLEPEFAAAREALARLYVEQARYAQALPALERLLAAQPDNARALFLLGESRRGLGEGERASRHFRRACQLDFQAACGL